MSVLWIAFGIYILGVAIVLYIRPGIMFREDGGSWKEFGLSSKGSYTVFPFWLFAVTWAFLSYTIATMSALFFASLAMRSLPNNSAPRSPNILQNLSTSINGDIGPISSNPNMPTNVANNYMNNIKPISSQVQVQQPGYYVLETQSSGPPRYVYFGQEPPRYYNL